jgi:hypothetical protein
MKRSLGVAVTACLLFTGEASMLQAQSGSDADAVAAITKLEHDFVKAALANSREFTQKYVADQFVGGSSFGKWETKADMLKDSENPANKVKSMSIHDLKVSAYGNAGIARYRMSYDDMHNGEHRARTVLCTDTWVKQGSAWQQMASHCSQTK